MHFTRLNECYDESFFILYLSLCYAVNHFKTLIKSGTDFSSILFIILSLSFRPLQPMNIPYFKWMRKNLESEKKNIVSTRHV